MKSFKTFLSELKLTIQYHPELNSQLWANMHLNDRLYFLSYAKKFAEFCSLDDISDIVLTGSNANFNYTKYSDIDIHILYRSSILSEEDLYKKKVEWETINPTLKYKGYKIEFYAQEDHEQFPNGQGVFSLLFDKWIIKPIHLDYIPVLEDPKTLLKLRYEIKHIKDLIRRGTYEEISAYKDKLYNMRSSGLSKEGEFSIENVIYKELRNRGLLDTLNKRFKMLQS